MRAFLTLLPNHRAVLTVIENGVHVETMIVFRRENWEQDLIRNYTGDTIH